MIREVLTNPNEHDKDNFVYLIYGIMDYGLGNEEMTSGELRGKVQMVRDSSQFYRASLIGHLDEKAATERFEYHGEIDQLGTFGSFGLILDPLNEDSIYIAWNSDLGSPSDPEELRQFALKHRGKRKSPFDLLTQTVGPEGVKYNELILQGDKDTAVRGVFFRGDDVKTRDRARTLTDIVCEEVKYEVPVIELPPYQRPSYEEIEDPEQRKLAQQCEVMGSQCQIMQAHLEFQDPNRRRYRFESELIYSYGREYSGIKIDPKQHGVIKN